MNQKRGENCFQGLSESLWMTHSVYSRLSIRSAVKIFLWGKHVFINCCCHFQDQGGIDIGDGTLIGSHVVIATINHGMKEAERKDNFPAPVRIGKNVWIGSHATLLPGVTVGDNAIVAAGAVVTKDVASNTVVGGVPAREMKEINALDRNEKHDWY